MPPAPLALQDGRGARRVVAFLPVPAILGMACADLVHYQTGLAHVAVYGAYLVLALVLPGTLVHKALRGPMETWAADLALGAATGLCLELGAWAVFSLLDIRGALWAWPLATLPLLLSHDARRRVLARPAGRWSWSTSLLVAVGVLVAGVRATRTYLRLYPLPPTPTTYYKDLPWHMGLAWESQRDFPLGTPQVVGDGLLKYHWFADAHIGIGSMITGIDVPTVTLRLWILPVLALTVLLTAALAHKVCGKGWGAGVAALLVVPATSPQLSVLNTWQFDPMTPLSPSQVFAMPVLLLLMHGLVDVVRDGRRAGGGTWVVVALATLASTGAKASAPVTVLGALGVTLLAALALRRRRTLLVGLMAGATISAAVAFKAVAGGIAGSGWQAFSNLSALTLYRQLVTSEPDLHTPILAGLFGEHHMAVPIIVALGLVTLLGALRTFVFVAPFLQRTLRRDLAAWLLAGACLATVVPFLVIAHDGYSQYYFVLGVVPLGATLLAWALVDIVGQDDRRARTAVAAGALGAVVTVGLTVRARLVPAPQTAEQWADTANAFVAWVTAAALALGVIGAVASWTRRRRGNSVAVPFALATVVGMVAVTGPLDETLGYLAAPNVTTPTAVATTTSEAPAQREASTMAAVNLAESSAAMWIQNHVPKTDITATNAQCISGHGLACDARLWWLSGLGGVKVLLSGWGYTPRATAQKRYYDPQLYLLNQSTFSDPTHAVISQMKAKGVRWLVGERLPGLDVSPRLADYGTKVYSNAYVEIYQLG